MKNRLSALFVMALILFALPALSLATGTVDGTVTDNAGNALVDAHIFILPDHGPAVAMAWSDSSGHFIMDEVPTGEFTARAVKHGFVPTEMEIVVVDGETVTLEIVMNPIAPPESGSISGTVTDADGNPVEGAFTTVWTHPYITTTTNADGEFSLETIPVGEHRFTAFSEGYLLYEEMVTIVADENLELNIVLETLQIGVVAGTVTDAEGNALDMAHVYLYQEDEHPVQHTFTDIDGNFVMDFVLAGDYSATSWKWGFNVSEAQDITVVEGDTTWVNFVLTEFEVEFGGVSGTVTTTDGTPIENALVSLTRPNHPHPCRVAFTNEIGEYLIEDAWAGDYILAAEFMGYAREEVPVVIVTGEILEADFVLEEGGGDEEVGAVQGVVTDSSGTAIANARVQLRPEPPDRHRPHYQTNTDENGEFVFPFVLAGEYSATACAHDYQREIQEIVVVADEVLELEFTLNPHGGGHWWSDYEPVELEGFAVVNEHRGFMHYFLDIENDEEVDYRLGFGPPWYEPESGATRPEAGDEISIVGGLIEREDRMPFVIVFEINGLAWFDPDTTARVNAVEIENERPMLSVAEGILNYNRNTGEYWLADADQNAIVPVALGTEDYESDAIPRPEPGTWISVVGGWYETSDLGEITVVYSINNEYWRSPGDMNGLDMLGMTDIEDESVVELPATHLLVSAYPNPFNPVTTLQVTVPEAGNLNIMVFDILGRQVQNVIVDNISQGVHQFSIDGAHWASGKYFVQVRHNNAVRVTGINLLK